MASVRTHLQVARGLHPSSPQLQLSHHTYNQLKVAIRACAVLHYCCLKAQVLDELSYLDWLDDFWIILNLCLSGHQGNQHGENA